MSNYPEGVTDNDPHFTDESPPQEITGECRRSDHLICASPLTCDCDCHDEPLKIPCSKCSQPTTYDPTYGDLCYRCIRADNE